MAWIIVPNTTNWEYSTTPEIDDAYNALNYTGNHVSGIRTNTDLTECYVYCRKTDVITGIGYGELSKTYLDAQV